MSGLDGWLLGVIGTVHMRQPAAREIVADWPPVIAGADQRWATSHFQERWQAMAATLKGTHPISTLGEAPS